MGYKTEIGKKYEFAFEKDMLEKANQLEKEGFQVKRSLNYQKENSYKYFEVEVIEYR